MDEQRTVLEQLNDFLVRRGIKISFLSRQSAAVTAAATKAESLHRRL